MNDDNNQSEQMLDEIFDGTGSVSEDVDNSAEAAEKEEASEASQSPEAAKEAADDSEADVSKDEDSSEKIEQLEKQVETLEKRVADTQRSYHQQSGRRAELERELEALKKEGMSSKEGEEEDDYNFFGDDDEDSQKDSDPTDDRQKKIEEVEKEIEAIDSADRERAVAEWDAEAKKFAEDHTDFDKKVGIFQPFFENNPAAQEEFRKRGGTPEAAYEMANEYLDSQGIQLKTEQPEEPEEKPAAKGSYNVNSLPPDTGAVKGYEYPGDDVLSEIGIPGF